jgi:GNAT superfamily N-acetyltransferase
MNFDEKGWQRFCKSCDVPTTESRLNSSDYFTLCNISENQITAIITMYKYEKLDQLYVSSLYQNKGIAKKLWGSAKKICIDNGNAGLYWVNSSTYAVPVYQNFGFKVSGQRQSSNGAAYTLLELSSE